MFALLEFAPLLGFLVAYYVRGFYVATVVLMSSMGLLLVVDYARTRRIPPMHAISAVLVFAFGTATLVLHDKRFVQWKPTVFFWLLALAFLGSQWLSAKTFVERLLAAPLGDAAAAVDQATWRRLNILWVVFYAVLGALNLWVAYHASERTWVNFKVFGLTLATLVFVGAQGLYLARKSASAPGADVARGDR